MLTLFRCIFTGVFLFLLPSLHAQKYYYDIYKKDDLVSFKSVHAVIKGPKDFLWIASAEGLFRFNGKTFEDFSTSLKSKNIYKLEKWDKDTILFVNDAGLFKLFYRERAVQIKPVVESVLIKQKGALYYPNDLFVDSRKNIWISQSDHSIVQLKDGLLEEYQFKQEKKRIPRRIFVKEDKNGTIWAATKLGTLAKYNTEKNLFEPVQTFNGIDAFQIFGDTLWVGSERLHLLKVTSNGRFRQISNEVIPGRLSSIARDMQGQFLLASLQGDIFFRSTYDQPLKKVFGSNDPHRVEELPFEQINNLQITPDPISKAGALWVATSNGLGLLQLKYFEGVEGLANNNVFSLATDEQKKVFINFGKLHIISQDVQGFNIEAFEGLDRVVAITASKQNIWLSTAEYEVHTLRNKRKLRTFDFSYRGGEIFYMFCDVDDNIWLCQAPSDSPILGVAKITPSGEVIEYGPESGLDNRILVVEQSSRNELYVAGIGVSTYLYRYFPRQDTFINLSLPMPFEVSNNFEVHDLSIDARGVVWLATTDGLLQYDSENINRIALGPYTTEEIRGVCALDDGSIWAATATDGLIYFRNNQYVLYDESCGLPSVVNSYRSLIKDGANRIWAGTAEGAVYSINDHPVPAVSTTPIVQQIRLNKRPLSNREAENIRLTSQARLAVDFISLAFPGAQTQYAYRLVPMKDEQLLQDISWNELNYDNKLELKKTPVGQYFLQIRARQKGGFQWSSPLVLPLNVHQVWYRSWWFIGGLFLLVIFSFWSYIRVFIIKRLKILEQQSSRQKKELARKQALLDAQSQEMQDQKEVLEETLSNLSKLHLIISNIPLEADWKEIITALGKAIDESIGIHAFEIAYVAHGIMHYHGYSMKEQGGFSFRSKGFDEKTSLASWAMANKKQVVINDFKKEHTQYVDKKDDYHFQSMSFIPFTFRNGKAAVLCTYNVQQNEFQEQEVLMLQLLTDYIALTTSGDFGKEEEE